MDARSGTDPLVVIVGQTASGKSALAMQLAGQFNGELICADAWTIRRGVDIGTAKPSKEDQARVPHHLLDIAGPDEDFTAAVFKGLAQHAIADVTARGKLPIMVGGTGLYIDGVLYDYGFLPAGNRHERESLNSKTNQELLELLAERKLSVEGIDTSNKRRLIRLLETNGARGEHADLRSRTLILGLRISKEKLHERITARVDAMLSAGLELEVKQLANTYGWDCEALKGIGYREWREYFEDAQSLAQTRDRIISSTLGLAKRQNTWFKRNDSIRWLNDPSDAVDLVTTFLNK